MAGNGVILYDASGNPLSVVGNTALTSSQAAALVAGSDYAASPKAQVPKVDSFGSVAVTTANPAGGPTLVNTGQVAGAAATQYGGLIMGRMDSPAPATFNPLTLDQVGALQVHQKSKVTFTVVALNVTCGTNVILLALQNASTMVLRLSRLNIYIPIAGGTGGALLGQGTGQSYYPVYCELRRVGSFTGGTAIAPVSSDSADTLASGITCAARPTALSGTPALFHQADAYATNVTGIPFYERGADANAKTFLVRPGECIAVVCTSNGVVNNSTAGGNNVVANANVTAAFTQAVA